MDGIIKSALRSNARTYNPTFFQDPWVALTIALEKPSPNIAAVRVWQSDGDNTGGVTTNISVWLHTFGQAAVSGNSTGNLPMGNQYAFKSGVLCVSGMWPTAGTATVAQWRFARCSQTIGSPGANYVTLQKFNNWVVNTANGMLYVAEVQILADGGWII